MHGKISDHDFMVYVDLRKIKISKLYYMATFIAHAHKIPEILSPADEQTLKAKIVEIIPKDILIEGIKRILEAEKVG